MPAPSRNKGQLFYGWVIVTAALIIGLAQFGTRYSFGVFFKSIEAEFGLTRSVTSGIFSAFALFSCIFAVAGGWAFDRYGPRRVIPVMGFFTGLSLLLTSQAGAYWQLFLTYSLLLSIGVGATFPVLMAMVSRWFHKKRGLALGIATSGGGLGTLAMAPFATYLISTFGWRRAYIVLGIIAWLVVISLSRLLKKDPGEIGALPDGASTITGEVPARYNAGSQGSNAPPPGYTLRQAFKSSSYRLLATIWLLFGSCIYLVITHVVPHATDIGISPMKAAGVLSLIGGFNVLGRLLMGMAADRIGRRATAIACGISIVAAMIWLIWSVDLWMFYLFATVYGFAYGGFDICMAALVSDVFGVSNIGAIMGTLSVGFSLGAAIGPFIGGLVFDATGEYSLAFAIVAAVMLTATIFTAFTRPRQTHD